MPTRALLRPVVVLLSSGFMRAWWNAQPHVDAPDSGSPGEFGEPEVFVPQKERARKRAVVIAGAAAAAVAAGVLYVLVI